MSAASNRLRVLGPLRTPALALMLACWISWPQDLASHGTLTTTVLFDREIVRILNNHCVMCHDDGGLAFPLVTYEQTWLRRNAVRMAILGRHTPWPAVAGYGRFANANSLTPREKQFVVGWVEGLGPRNAGSVFLNVADAGAATPPQDVRAFSHAGHWQVGEPDLTRRLEARSIPARQFNEVARTVLDLGLRSERHVRAIEYLPGDRRVVRAATFTLEQTGQWLGSWTPWYGFTSLPAGVSYRLPAGSRVVAEVHYRGASEPVVDAGTLGVFYAAPSATRAASDLILDARAAAPSSSTRLRATARITADTYVWALRPDFGPGVKSIEVSARGPDGSTEILLFAKDPSTEWPTPFILEPPRLIRRGTELSLVAHTADAGRPAPVRVSLSRY